MEFKRISRDPKGRWNSKQSEGIRRKRGKLAAYARKRVAAGAHLPSPWLFEPAKYPDDKADYCLDRFEEQKEFKGIRKFLVDPK